MKANVFLVVLTFSVAAQAEEPFRHTVKAGESCASIAQRYLGDARYVDLLHQANAGLFDKPPPHTLREGTVLVIPPKPSARTGPDAELTTVRNRVEVSNPEPKRGKPNDPLFRGNRVSTEAASAADVTFRDETQVKLGERTLVIILGDAQSAAARVGSEPQTTLVTGNLRAFMAGPAKGAIPVATDAAKVRVYGEAQVSSDPQKTTRLAVYGGSSTIDARGRTREVARGFGSKAELGQPPTAPRALLPAPEWTASPPLVLVERADKADAPVVIVGAYDLPSGAASGWHVQVAHDGIFRDVVADVKAAANVRRLETRVPGSGRYYVRVSAIDDDHFEGPFGMTARTLVVKPTITTLADGRRSIEIDPPDAFCVRVGNAVLSRLEGHPLVVGTAEPVRLRCAPNESDPTTLIVLDSKPIER